MRALSLMLFAFLVCAEGCSSENKVRISGHIAKNGQPMKFSNTSMRTLTFLPEPMDAKQPQVYPSFLKQEGDFAVELPPGKYKVHLNVEDGQGDVFGGKFSQQNSKLMLDVTTSKTMVIEVGK